MPIQQGTGISSNGDLTPRGAARSSYDQANRLTSAIIAGVTTSYAYDGDGKRVSSQVGTNPATRYLYDINAGLPVLLEDGTRKYVWGLGLAYAVDSAGNVEVSHTDGLGSVRALTDSAGLVVQTYDTDEFGIPVTAGTQGSRTQPFGYTGEQRDAESGFVYLRARMYDPQIGRFLQKDPFAGFMGISLSLNRYSYVLNNPANLTDPTGLAATNAVLSRDVTVAPFGAGSVAGAGLPVLYLSGSQMPWIARHILAAQGAGHPDILTYDPDPGRRDQRRQSVCPRAAFRPPGLSCDEYPFASTYQGGDAAISTTGRKASTRWVPISEQRAQGLAIANFVLANRLKGGDQYRVVVSPPPPPTLPTIVFIPWPGRSPLPAPRPQWGWSVKLLHNTFPSIAAIPHNFAGEINERAVPKALVCLAWSDCAWQSGEP